MMKLLVLVAIPGYLQTFGSLKKKAEGRGGDGLGRAPFKKKNIKF